MTINYGEYTSPKNINPSVKREQDYQDMGERGIEEFLRSPDARTVEDFHSSADTDMGAHSIHHTLGIRQYQASPGHHNHNGENSVRIDGQNLLWGDDEIKPQFKLVSIDWASGFSGTAWGATFGPLKMLRWICNTPMSQDVLVNPVGTVPENSGYRPPYTVIPTIYGNGGWYAVGALNATGTIVVRIARNVTSHTAQVMWLDATLPT